MCSSHETVISLFLPVGIQHNQCSCRFFNARSDTSSVVTKVRHRDTTLPRMLQAQQQWATQCHVIILDTTGNTYTFYEIEKRKETERKQKQRQIGREKAKKKREKKCHLATRVCRLRPPFVNFNILCPTPGGCVRQNEQGGFNIHSRHKTPFIQQGEEKTKINETLLLLIVSFGIKKKKNAL